MGGGGLVRGGQGGCKRRIEVFGNIKENSGGGGVGSWGVGDVRVEGVRVNVTQR